MDKHAIFEAWAPPGAAWSPWVKPVLFAHLPRRLPAYSEVAPPDVSWAPPPAEPAAIVMELPGVESVAMGLALAEVGYRPVPLFNACPPPEGDEWFDQAKGEPVSRAVVDVDTILAALVRGADRLRALHLPPEAPPAFLLDRWRKGRGRPVGPAMFDNRSVLFVTDVPSAALLAARGIRQAIVVLGLDGPFQPDLDHVLRSWRRDGLELALKALDRPGPPRPLDLRRPNPLAGLWIRFAAWIGLRRNERGEFGDFVPEATGG